MRIAHFRSRARMSADATPASWAKATASTSRPGRSFTWRPRLSVPSSKRAGSSSNALRSRALVRAITLSFLFLAVAACRTPGSFTPRTDGVDVRDALEPLIQAVRAAPDDRTAGEAWSRSLADLGMPVEGVKPEPLGKAIRASLPQLESVSASGPSEAREVAAAVGSLHGRSVTARVWLAALRDDTITLDVQPDRIVLNARSSAAAEPRARRALLARAMSSSLLPPTSGSLGPLAGVVYRQSLCAAAALSVAPGGLEDDPRLRARLPLLARELLASLDSAAPAQVDRFFGATADPLLPRGSGAFLSTELGAALIQDLGTAEKVVRLTPGEFRRHASQALQRLAAAP